MVETVLYSIQQDPHAVIAPKQVSDVCRVVRVVQAAVGGGGGGGGGDDDIRQTDGKGEKAIWNMLRIVVVQ